MFIFQSKIFVANDGKILDTLSKNKVLPTTHFGDKSFLSIGSFVAQERFCEEQSRMSTEDVWSNTLEL